MKKNKGYYHIFTDNKDFYATTESKAVKIFDRLCVDYENVRLYFFENDGDEYGQCVDFKGGFPI
jgi:hypothetical protein